MRRYVVNYAWLPIIFFLGCSTTSPERWRDIDRRIAELSQTTQALERKMDDLSRSISLIVSDSNKLHNEMDDVKTSSRVIQQKVEGIEIVLKDLDGRTGSLETNYKDMEDELHKRIDDIEKAGIELSNLLEIMKLDIKEGGKEKTVSPSLP
jgi:chromosome segregation ATPase